MLNPLCAGIEYTQSQPGFILNKWMQLPVINPRVVVVVSNKKYFYLKLEIA